MRHMLYALPFALITPALTTPSLAQCPPSCPEGTFGVDVDFARALFAGIDAIELNILLQAVRDSNLDEERKAELVAIIAEVAFTGITKSGQSDVTFGTMSEFVEDILARVLASYVGFRDPFAASDATYTNVTNETQHVSIGIFLPNDPDISGSYTARTYLAIDLIDANGDGAALLEPSFILGAMAENAGVTRNGLILDLTPRVGATIVGPTDQTVIFDTGLVAGTVPDGDEIVDLFPSMQFLLSPGDEVRVRGFMAIFPEGVFQIEPEDALDLAAIFLEGGCAADLDGDSDADADDFFAYLDAFAAGDTARCDIDRDGDCDADDFFAYLDTFAAGC